MKHGLLQGLAGLSWALTPETGESLTQPINGHLLCSGRVARREDDPT